MVGYEIKNVRWFPELDYAVVNKNWFPKPERLEFSVEEELSKKLKKLGVSTDVDYSKK
jgi:hypothetical protein